MTESDNTWNADEQPPTSEARPPEIGSAPEPETDVPDPDPAWPQYSWPPTATPPQAGVGASETTSQAPAIPPVAETGPVSWPPTQPTPAVEPTATYPPVPPTPDPWGAGPYATAQYPTGAYAPGPYAPNPYAAGPYAGSDAGGAGSWAGPPPGWTAATPPNWPTAPAPATPSKARRGLAALAALALVVASAGVGAGVAIAVHNNSKTQTFSASPSTGFNNGNGNGTGNPFGNLGGGDSGLGDNGSGTIPSGTGTLDQSAIAAKVDPALVDINTTLAQGRAAGTGMILTSTGEILTNNHVIADATSIKVTIGGIGKTYDAKVVGYDVTEDVALVQITDKVSNLPTVTLGNPSKLQVGDPVVALGNALGKGGVFSASQGQVTRLGQEVTAGDEGGNQETLEGMIQINAPIQPGDSGGALVDRTGAIVGMNTAAAGGGNFNSQSGSNVGFAIPIDKAISIVKIIRAGTETDKVHIGDRALLGVQVQNLNGQTSPVTAGALVVGVQAKTGASDAGIKENDVVVEVDGKAVTDSDTLRATLVKLHPGDSVNVVWVDSNGARHNADVKLIPGPPL